VVRHQVVAAQRETNSCNKLRRTTRNEERIVLKDEKRAAKNPKPAKEEVREIKGRVLGPDGKPVGGASIYTSNHELVKPPGSAQPATQMAALNSRSRRRNTAITSRPRLKPWDRMGGGSGRRQEGRSDAPLVKADAPITGQIIDLEGSRLRAQP